MPPPSADAADTACSPSATAATGTLYTGASSITRALDQVGDKWCLLIIQEVFWGINSFSDMLDATGASRGVLSDRLNWLQQIGCLRKREPIRGRRGGSYHLTQKSLSLHASAMMAIEWERKYYRTPNLDSLKLHHRNCGNTFQPQMRCSRCVGPVNGQKLHYQTGPGATRDVHHRKVRRRSSLSSSDVPSQRSVYRKLIDLVGDRWTANVIALAFHRITRFDEFRRELPIATNILSDRLKRLEREGVFDARAYQQRPARFEYHLTEKGWDLFPYFLTLLQWGDRWCDPQNLGPPTLVYHDSCGNRLHGEVICDQCAAVLDPFHVTVSLDGR